MNHLKFVLTFIIRMLPCRLWFYFILMPRELTSCLNEKHIEYQNMCLLAP
jgi:hypothetical protein